VIGQSSTVPNGNVQGVSTPNNNTINNQMNYQNPQQVNSNVQEASSEKSFIKSEEEIKKIEGNYKPPGKFKTFLLLVFFALLIAFVIFLPEIQIYMDEYFSGDDNKSENITTGKLVCRLDQSSSNLDNIIVRKFNYTNNKLDSAVFETTIKGDLTEDEKTLDELAEKCKTIKENVSSLSGISVTCEYDAGKLIEKESFDYKIYNAEEVRAAYTEAGGDMIEYDAGYDIDKIMTTMRQSGFDCNKEK